jgi:cytochrome b
MSVVTATTRSGGAMPPATVKVWDLFVRVFHWSLVTFFVIAYATGDEIEKVHIAAGCAIAALLAMRVVWGFVGPRHACFNSFVPPLGRCSNICAMCFASGHRALSAITLRGER